MHTDRPLRLLVVDDHVDGVDSLADLLNVLGWVTERAYSGSQAIALAGTFRPDIVVVDINMPGMDGFETARRISHIASLPSLRIVGYSGSADAPLVRSTGSELIECIVSKGAPLQVLLDVLGKQP